MSLYLTHRRGADATRSFYREYFVCSIIHTVWYARYGVWPVKKIQYKLQIQVAGFLAVVIYLAIHSGKFPVIKQSEIGSVNYGVLGVLK